MKKSTIVHQTLPTCACCIAAYLTAPVATAIKVGGARALSEQSFLGLYDPTNNVDAIAALDLDQRSIVARLATGDRNGLTEAQSISSNGRRISELNIKSLST